MRIDLTDGVLVEFESVAEAEDFMNDAEEAIFDRGNDVCSSLINADGVHTLTVRVVG